MSTSNVSSQKSIPQLVLGAGTFRSGCADGTQPTPRLHSAKDAQPLVDLFKSHGYVEVDTARSYTGSEAILGQLDRSTLTDLQISTKAHPFIAPFSNEGLRQQLDESLTALGVEYVDTFYLHVPDESVPIEDTMMAVNSLFVQGKFRRFGLSNFSAPQIEEIIALCKAKGYVAPTVYQGMYSPIARSDYLAHQDVLKRHNIGYYAYGATASGLLTGKHRFDQEPSAGTRFGYASRVNGGRLFKRYWHREVFAAVDLLAEAAAKKGISLTEATHRWLRHHSGMGEGDAILVGVSSLKQLEQNLDDLEMGPLPADLVDAFEEAWKVVEHLQIISIPSALDKEG